MQDLRTVLSKLVQYQSITPMDAGCQAYMIDQLQALGFACQRFDNLPVANFFARIGTQAPLLIFAGHTDVVPIGEHSKWATDPFVLHENNDFVFGRGVADMKGSLACMLKTAERFVKNHPHWIGSLGFLITSGEEGDQFDLGTPYVMAQLQARGIKPDYCIVGEPSSSKTIADVIKIGRRGSLTGQLTLHGKQGHVAYPHLAANPIHMISPVLLELSTAEWDQGNEHFPPTSFQITHIQSGGQANNIIPGELTLQFNFRYSTEQNVTSLQAAVQNCFLRHGLQSTITWRLSGEPFLTSKGKLLTSCMDVIRQCTGQTPALSTSGGTSDGRFIAPFGVEVIELGPVNATIHQVNECVSMSDLAMLVDIYYAVCKQLLCS
jgi:succinyl-diaminopimelate desuccinylase